MTHVSIEGLSWELSVLSKAVAYKNLSGAAANIGISQPQLSRIVNRLESELPGVLLDRGSKRKSAWTPLAHQLAEAYLKSVRSLNGTVEKLLDGSEPRLIHIGTLEGLIPLAMNAGHELLRQTSVRMLELNVYDLNQLEEIFFRGDLDLIFTSREPGRKKYAYRRDLGYQSLELIERSADFRVVSSYEFGMRHSRQASRENDAKLVISNSLLLRRQWLESYGGEGTIPSAIRSSRKNSGKSAGRSVKEEEIFLFAQDSFSPELWKKIAQWKA